MFTVFATKGPETVTNNLAPRSTKRGRMSKGVSWQMAVFPPNVPSWARIWQVTTRGSPTSRLLGPLTPIPALPLEACLSVTVSSHTEIRSHRVSSLGRLCPSPAGWRKPGRWDPNSTSNTAGSPWGWSPGPECPQVNPMDPCLGGRGRATACLSQLKTSSHPGTVALTPESSPPTVLSLCCCAVTGAGH